MRTLCDGCESAAAVVFCAADEAALCGSCDEKEPSVGQNIHVLPTENCCVYCKMWDLSPCKTLVVHMCNKLANRHVRVGLANPSDVPRCDICEDAPAFFYCETDGSSLCLQCDMIVHVGGKRTHKRYLLLRQRVEFPGDKPADHEDRDPQPMDSAEPREQNRRVTVRNHRALSPVQNANTERHEKMENNMIDLNIQPNRMHEHASTDQDA